MKKQNQAEALRLAGSTMRGRTLVEEASRTLTKPQCKSYLKKLRKKSEEKAVKNAADIIAELEKLAFSNMKNYFDAEKTFVLKKIEEMTDEELAAVSEIVVNPLGGTVKLKLHDKHTSLKSLGLRFGIFPTSIEHKGIDTLAQAVHKAMTGKK